MDVVIVGGGPAGLSAALVLGRSRRHVLICDEGNPRNRRSRGVNGFLSRDGIAPDKLRAVSREELRAYPSLVFRNTRVVDIVPHTGSFTVELADGSTVTCRKVLLATGLEVELPHIHGIDELYGRGAYDCPYCDGWEASDGAIAIYGSGVKGKDLALELLGWSDDVTLFTGGTPLSQEHRDKLRRFKIGVCTETIEALHPAEDGILIQMRDGRWWPKKALFFISEGREVSSLVKKLGCNLTERGVVSTGANECTNVHGVYVAGDASRRVSFAIVAAAEGALAAFAINQELLKDDRSLTKQATGRSQHDFLAGIGAS